MISEMLVTYLSFFPKKLPKFSNNNRIQRSNDFIFTKEEIFYENFMLNQIEKSIRKISYGNLENIIKKFYDILSLDLNSRKFDLSKLTEIKECRNLIIHNNLVVNES